MRPQTHPRAWSTSAGRPGTREGLARQSGCVWRTRGLGGELGVVVVMAPRPQLLGLWDTPRSRALLPGLLRADRSVFCARRDVSRRCRLPPGHYLVVPSASRVGDEADFTLRIFSERSHTAV